eukprot:6192328-Pleurochrysis_carterae.AAC.5
MSVRACSLDALRSRLWEAIGDAGFGACCGCFTAHDRRDVVQVCCRTSLAPAAKLRIQNGVDRRHSAC